MKLGPDPDRTRRNRPAEPRGKRSPNGCATYVAPFLPLGEHNVFREPGTTRHRRSVDLGSQMSRSATGQGPGNSTLSNKTCIVGIIKGVCSMRFFIIIIAMSLLLWHLAPRQSLKRNNPPQPSRRKTKTPPKNKIRAGIGRARPTDLARP